MVAAARVEVLSALGLIAGYLAIVGLALLMGGMDACGVVLTFSFVLSVALLVARIPRLLIEPLRNQRRWQRAARGHCIQCDYDLRASAVRCPECGCAVDSLEFRDGRLGGAPIIAGLTFIALASLIIALSVPVYGSGREIKPKATRAMLSNIKSQLDQFNHELGRYPTTAEGLAALVSDPGTVPTWSHPFMDKLPVDAWNNRLVYRFPGARGAAYDLYAVGPNGRDDGGGGDDIRPDN